MARVCRKYIIHVEWDENNTTDELRKKRAFKTNIISHDYRFLYQSLGKKVAKFKTYRDVTDSFKQLQSNVTTKLERWEGFEGPEKYILIVIEL